MTDTRPLSEPVTTTPLSSPLNSRLRVLDDFREELADVTAPIEAMHADRIECKKGCSDCCLDDLTVFEAEAEAIRARHGAVLDQEPHPPGACAFLDGDGACRIYADRPYVCRTQGLPLRWGDADDAGEAVERRDICPKNDGPEHPPLTELAADECFELGPHEGRLATLEATRSGTFDGLERIALRDLFRSV